jgi:TolB protein
MRDSEKIRGMLKERGDEVFFGHSGALSKLKAVRRMWRHRMPALVLLFLVSSAVAAAPTERIVWSHLDRSLGLYLSNSDGGNERPFLAGSGSNYNPSFSSDGRWIVFTSERFGSADIFRVHPDGSGLERLTDDPAFDDQGTLSPDGRTLAFVSTRGGGTANIWLLDIASHRISNLTKNRAGNFRPSWSPDGQWIAFSSDRNTHPGRYVRSNGEPAWELMQTTAIYIAHPDGSGLRRLTPLDQDAGSPKWSRDGRRLLFYQVTDVESMRHSKGIGTEVVSIDIESDARQIHSDGTKLALSPGYRGDSEIGYVLKERRAAREASLLYDSGRKGPTGAENPSWSPDGSVVVFDRDVPVEHGWAEVRPSRDPRYELIGGAAINTDFIAFTAEGDWLVYPSGRPYSTLNLVARDGSDSRVIFGAGLAREEIGSVALSADGRNVAIQVGGNFRRPVEPSQIAVMKSDGSALRTLTHDNNNNGFPNYSPDGKRIVYRTLGAVEGLRILSLADGRVFKLTRGWDDFPVWSPRGDRIAFAGFETGDFEIYTIRPDGSALRQLTHTHGSDAHPVWSPDGQWLAFCSSRAGFKDEHLYSREIQPYGDIFVMRADGTDLRQITDNQWEELVLAWLR